MKKQLMACAVILATTCGIHAQNDTNSCQIESHDLLRLGVDVRVDYQHLWQDHHTSDPNTGFEGKYFMFRADGEILPGLTYSWRQRLNKNHDDSSFFDATDWMYINYSTGRFEIAGGKQVACIGGWEYDRHPADLYSTSLFWQNIPCFQLGASVGYHVTKSDLLTAQVTQSLFHTSANRNMYTYNLMWTGSHGPFSTLWSANMIEYLPGRYISYLSLGNRLELGKVTVELDLMNRAASGQTFLFKDCSVMGEAAWCPDTRWRLHGKVTYDVNRAGNNADYTVLPGTELTMAGGGVEFYPFIKKRGAVRLHANCYYSWGRNANSADLMQHNSVMLSAGVRCHIDLLSFKHNR
ncbi:porin [uncultured Duncaniella sp.]|uniref:porin n=1 Tax=uncultured Duncaniella sp. TaxID=2768039 RepID=UPI002675246B|nr:porin [uncultured Duncaniella sp.]